MEEHYKVEMLSTLLERMLERRTTSLSELEAFKTGDEIPTFRLEAHQRHQGRVCGEESGNGMRRRYREFLRLNANKMKTQNKMRKMSIRTVGGNTTNKPSAESSTKYLDKMCP
ncbi:hypothetical protein CHS0354_028004 [Potamilus streckersoni]|uniref:Uncharacterized protein n=1 Tax=Potamilus streckersoni TaxID=2493646 RepID=A0AAE0T4C4_9BIVA|nr:hypothetical protein CHS0354_028004 [Potamilus streckersoni]